MRASRQLTPQGEFGLRLPKGIVCTPRRESCRSGGGGVFSLFFLCGDGSWRMGRTELRTSEIRKDSFSSNQVLVDWAFEILGSSVSGFLFFSPLFFFPPPLLYLFIYIFFWLANSKGWLAERLVTTSWGYS